ncbi:MAG: hypothetical protein NE328_03435 [Lentisphaeraceae bacterium]|nr:hypothetical protein [Lentisphaeraceae bacterium]
MKSIIIILCVIITSCDSDSHLTEEIIFAAKENNFPYSDTLKKAKSGDASSIEAMMKFYKKTDAGSSFSHSVYMYEILHNVGEEKFFNILSKQDRKIINWNLNWLQDRNHKLYKDYPKLKKLKE